MKQLNPIQWAILPLKKYATFSGRAPRAEYWWFTLATAIVAFVLGMTDALVLHGPVYGNYGVLSLTFLIGSACPGLAVEVRRLHDTGRSGWFVLVGIPRLVFVVMGRSPFAAGALVDGAPSWIIAAFIAVMLVWIVAAIALFVFMVTPSTKGSNEYGSDPYGPSDLEEVFA
jgi:uncharacterized membrane protein YhaH (DUF805 family)